MAHRATLLRILCCSLFLASSACADDPAGTVKVQILALNDFHGNLDPPTGSAGQVTTDRPCVMNADCASYGADTVCSQSTAGGVTRSTCVVNAGGGEYLATHVWNLMSRSPNTIFVSAGDLVGASPLVSALFHDEPTIELFNLLGLDDHAVGNHEFDEGPDELRRLQAGGCHPSDGCLDGDAFDGAAFPFLAANVIRVDDEQPLFPSYEIHAFAGARVAVIGLTLEDTPAIVLPAGTAGLHFTAEAASVNAIVRGLQDGYGIETFVVAVHQGGVSSAWSYNSCDGVTAADARNQPILDIVSQLDDAVDVVITGHTHIAYNCVLPNQHGHDLIVTQAASFGRIVTSIELAIDRASGDVVSAAANNNLVSRTVAKDATAKALIDKYRALVAPLASRAIGQITSDITAAPTSAGESALGDVIADAQLWDAATPAMGDAVVAFTNPGGIRGDLSYASSAAGEGDGNVTFGEAFTVQPFANVMTAMDLTGAQIKAVLEQQIFTPDANGFPTRILQVSGFTYAWSASAPAGDRIIASSMRIQGAAVDMARSYRVACNSFLASGGDGFSVFAQGKNRQAGDIDVDALVKYAGSHSPVPPGLRDRIQRVP